MMISYDIIIQVHHEAELNTSPVEDDVEIVDDGQSDAFAVSCDVTSLPCV